MQRIVATVGLTTGRIVAKLAGTTVITVTTNDGSYVASCTVTVNYCGGSEYRDVTRHAMVLQGDGYYVCSTCGYRVKSPELEDRDILSSDDYLKSICCQMCYSYIETIIQSVSGTESLSTYQNIVHQLVAEIRQQSKYNGLYSYIDSKGKCVGPTIDYDTGHSAVFINELDIISIGEYNGLSDAIHDMVIGYFCPIIPLAQSIIDLLNREMNALEFSALVLDEFGYKNFANGLSMASDVIEILGADVGLDDCVVIVDACRVIRGHYIFSSEGKFKLVKYYLLNNPM